MSRQLTEADVISLAAAVAGEGGGGTGDGDMKKSVYDSTEEVKDAGGIKAFVEANAITVDDELSDSSENPVQNKVITSALADKVDAVSGKGLSTNDYTDAEAEKLAALVEVEANPSDSASETLTKIKVDDTVYSVPNGGGGGTSDYTELSNKPQINSHTLSGNQSGSDLGLVDAVSGKGLSENDYTDADKAIVDGVTTALSNKVDKVSGKGLSTNDYDNTAKGIVDGVTTALAGKVDTSSVGANSGIAQLDATGKVPSSQLPSYVDDVLEYNSQSAFPATGEESKIYIAKDTNKTYRWSGSAYVEISESLALGETSSTAYAGDKGKANADNISTIQGLIPSSATTSNKLATASDIPSITGKADKVSGATNGDLAGLDANGNLTDSGILASNVVTKSNTTGLLKNDGTVDTNTYLTSVPLASSNSIGGIKAGGEYDDYFNIDSVSGRLEPKFHELTPSSEGDGFAYSSSVYDAINDVYKSNGIFGAKNLYKNTAVSKTENNVTFTVNSDGTVTVTTGEGGASAETTLSLAGSVLVGVLKDGVEYRLSGCPVNGSASSYYLRFNQYYSGESHFTFDYGEGADFTFNGLTGNNIGLSLVIANGAELSDVVFKPMITLASDTDSTYVPYAMTNKELTDGKADKTELDGWTSQSQVSSGSISFSGIDDTNNNAYDLYISVDSNSTELNPTYQITAISGTGTSSMSITFSTNADEGAYGKLRILK